MTVLVPTYRRPNDLRRCLTALNCQDRRADAILVVCRNDDLETRELLQSEFTLPELATVFVEVPGQVAALNAGLDAVRGDIVAITDDDAAPWPGWLEKIENHFVSDPRIGGVGGRDHVASPLREPDAETVGVIQWFGRQIGNHHLGVGRPRMVQMLKGANMSYRVAAIGDVRFDRRLRGSGAQVNNDLAFSLAIGRRGWKLLYDPAVAVDHFPAVRFDDDQRSARSVQAVTNAAFNETLTLLDHLHPVRRPIYLAWAILVGPRDVPGFIQCIRLRRWGRAGWTSFVAVVKGRLAAVDFHLRQNIVTG